MRQSLLLMPFFKNVAPTAAAVTRPRLDFSLRSRKTSVAISGTATKVPKYPLVQNSILVVYDAVLGTEV